MIAALPVIFFVAASWFFPKLTKYFFTAPLLGSCSGGLLWCVVALINNELVTLRAIGTFMLTGIILAEAFAIVASKD